MRIVTTKWRRPLASRWGSSLVELVAALALFSIIGAAMLRALDRQARFHDGATRMLESRSQLAAVTDAIGAELRSVGGAAGDVQRITDTSVVYRQQVGGGIACAVVPGAIYMAPDRLSGGQALSHFASSPQAGDTAWIFDEGRLVAASDDRWLAASVTGATRVASGCLGSDFVDPLTDASSLGWRLVLPASDVLPPTVAAGAAVRLTRPARFVLYRASGGDTFLGWTDWNAAAGAWNVIQPVAGPLVPYASARPAAAGIALRAWDSLGAPIPPGLVAPSVARFRIMVRSVTRGALRADGMPRGVGIDSLASILTLRNMR